MIRGSRLPIRHVVVPSVDFAPTAAGPRRHGVLRGTQGRGDPRRIPVPRDPDCIPSSGRGQKDPKRERRDREPDRSEEHTSELQSLAYLVCRLLLEKKKIIIRNMRQYYHYTLN